MKMEPRASVGWNSGGRRFIVRNGSDLCASSNMVDCTESEAQALEAMTLI